LEFKFFSRRQPFEFIYIDESLQNIYTCLAPNCMSLCRVTRKIVATIGTFKKLQDVILEKYGGIMCGAKEGQFGLI
jgi:hypothetical protein